MDPIYIVLIVLLVLIIAIVLWWVSTYNGLVTLRNRFKNAWAQIDVQLQRRYDLIPNLVETARAFLTHERETLEAVMQARNGAVQASRRAAADPSDSGAVSSLLVAEGMLGGALGRLIAVAEDTPELKSDATMRDLMEELTSTENKVAFARQAYNDSATAYNTARERFPDNMVAGAMQFAPATHYEVVDAAVRAAPKVSFG